MILNTQQIILLCLLVSFVTAAATGITVVSLMQQTSEPVTQTINRVVERTVETVTQQPVEELRNILSQEPREPREQTSTQSERETVTVVVNQEDRTIDAVEKNQQSLVRIVRDNQVGDFVTLGIILNKEGDVLVDRRAINQNAAYRGVYARGEFLLRIDNSFSNQNFAIYKITENTEANFTPMTWGDSDGLKLAQSVISLSGSQSNTVSIGEVTGLNKNSEGNLTSIQTSVNPSNVLTGSAILNLSGAVIGFRGSTPEDRTVFVPINRLKAELGL